MDLGLDGWRVTVVGEGALAERCATAFAAEGAVTVDTDSDPAAWDVVVAIAPSHNSATTEGPGDDAAALAAWGHVTALVPILRAASAGMAERGRGRMVWVGPLDAKLTRDDPRDDLGGLVGLGALGLFKAMSGELGPDGITCNSVLWDGEDADAAVAAILFLCSKPAGYVTGTALSVDGGRSGSIF
ncbi:MAG: hypothetical protein ABW048_10995 [Sphingobium sp.]